MDVRLVTVRRPLVAAMLLVTACAPGTSDRSAADTVESIPSSAATVTSGGPDEIQCGAAALLEQLSLDHAPYGYWVGVESVISIDGVDEVTKLEIVRLATERGELRLQAGFVSTEDLARMLNDYEAVDVFVGAYGMIFAGVGSDPGARPDIVFCYGINDAIDADEPVTGISREAFVGLMIAGDLDQLRQRAIVPSG